ncbi:MAG: sulfite exporter TauE/SafE family protein [Candidatus Nanopelagicales bacterium]
MTNPLTLLAIGAALGLVIGLLGGGGGILAVPLLIAAGQPFIVASSQSLLIVSAGAIAALVPHHRARRVEWKVGATFGALGAVGALVGAWIAPSIAPAILLGGLAFLLLAGAVAMLRNAFGDQTLAETRAQRRAGVVPASGTPQAAPSTADTADAPDAAPPSSPARVVGLASSVGLVTGLLGVGAGFVVVPALVSAMKLPIKKASATALVVIVINSAVAAIVRHGNLGTPAEAAGLAAASATFAVIGALLSRRIPGWMLSAAFGVLMILVAIYTVVHAVVSG